MTFTTTIELPVTVEFDYTPACPGSRERGTGLALEPDEPESCEITSVATVGAVPVEMDLPDDIMDRLKAEAMDHVREASADTRMDRAEMEEEP